MKDLNPVFRVVVGMSFLTASGGVMAQSLDALGGGFINAICQFIDSPIVVGLAAVALVALLILWMMDEARGFMGSLLKIAIGVAVILNIGTVTQLMGLSPIC
ncbi:MAG: hypothetical protein DDT34_02189 [Firmicutes bacterium]|nr:hypothetical protein [Bacillota bacterium]